MESGFRRPGRPPPQSSPARYARIADAPDRHRSRSSGADRRGCGTVGRRRGNRPRGAGANRGPHLDRAARRGPGRPRRGMGPRAGREPACGGAGRRGHRDAQLRLLRLRDGRLGRRLAERAGGHHPGRLVWSGLGSGPGGGSLGRDRRLHRWNRVVPRGPGAHRAGARARQVRAAVAGGRAGDRRPAGADLLGRCRRLHRGRGREPDAGRRLPNAGRSSTVPRAWLLTPTAAPSRPTARWSRCRWVC
jgi:hypothetical protein